MEQDLKERKSKAEQNIEKDSPSTWSYGLGNWVVNVDGSSQVQSDTARSGGFGSEKGILQLNKDIAPPMTRPPGIKVVSWPENCVNEVKDVESCENHNKSA